MYKPSPAPSGRESASLGLLTVLRHLYGVIIADEKTQTSSVSFFKGEKNCQEEKEFFFYSNPQH